MSSWGAFFDCFAAVSRFSSSMHDKGVKSYLGHMFPISEIDYGIWTPFFWNLAGMAGSSTYHGTVHVVLRCQMENYSRVSFLPRQREECGRLRGPLRVQLLLGFKGVLLALQSPTLVVVGAIDNYRSLRGLDGGFGLSGRFVLSQPEESQPWVHRRRVACSKASSFAAAHERYGGSDHDLADSTMSAFCRCSVCFSGRRFSLLYW